MYESLGLTVMVAPIAPVSGLAVGAGAGKVPGVHQASAERSGAILAAQREAGRLGVPAAGDDHGLGLAVVGDDGVPGGSHVLEPLAGGLDVSVA